MTLKFFLTETWLRKKGDEAKCTDLTKPEHCKKSFRRSSRGGRLAVISKDDVSSRICFTTSFPCDHSSSELAQVSSTLPQQNSHFFCLYRPSPSRKNEIHRLLVSRPVSRPTPPLQFSPRDSLIIHGDFNGHYDCPQNFTTTRAMGLLFQLNLTQSVSQVSWYFKPSQPQRITSGLLYPKPPIKMIHPRLARAHIR